MADAKISELPAATLPLAGTELVPIVQGAVTKKIQISQLADELIRIGGGTVTPPAPAFVSSGLLYPFTTDYTGVA
jgi:hypothetical protein